MKKSELEAVVVLFAVAVQAETEAKCKPRLRHAILAFANTGVPLEDAMKLIEVGTAKVVACTTSEEYEKMFKQACSALVSKGDDYKRSLVGAVLEVCMADGSAIGEHAGLIFNISTQLKLKVR